MRRWWLAYGGGAALVCAALFTVSVDVLELERSERAARAEGLRQERLRLALWRMESWLAPRLTTENARPYFEYSAFYPRDRPYESLLWSPEDSGELVWSPLLVWQSPDIPLHIQVDEDARYASPQVPGDSLRDEALAVCLSEEELAQSAALLAEVEAALPAPTLESAVAEGLAAFGVPEGPAAGLPRDEPGPSPWVAVDAGQTARNTAEFSRRARVLSESSQLGNYLPPVTAGGLDVGPFVPIWFDEPARLLYARRVSLGGHTLHQGFLVDWPRLRQHLLDAVADLLGPAELIPLRDCQPAESEAGLVLAGVPALLRAEPLAPAADEAGPGLTPVRRALVLSWSAVLVALAGVGLVLRSAVVLGERRVRFASAVTHELRTPLTTFRLYAEMLADDMVPDAERRREYLTTLRDESDRLARLVENVLAYARIEQGRSPVELRDTTVGALLSAAVPTLRRRTEEAGLTLVVDEGGLAGRPLRTDGPVVAQVLFNLVDNAVKYAGRGTVRLGAAVRDQRLVLEVADEGPGVDEAARRVLFRPFERSAPEATPGVGLGLSLSRSLARELGGELELASAPGEGARFRLELPLPG